jgi:sugar/nucleoside kinase (ribokinase family)
MTVSGGSRKVYHIASSEGIHENTPSPSGTGLESPAMTTSRDIDCLVCGTCVADILVRPVGLNQPIGGGRLIHVDPIDVVTGGIVCNTGIGLARLGGSVAAASLVGHDPWAEVIRNRLSTEGIDTSPLTAHDTLGTSTTAVLIDPGGERSFAHHGGAPYALDLSFIDGLQRHFVRSRWAVIGYLGLLPGLEPDLGAAVERAQQAGCLVALETGGAGGTLEQLTPALPHLDLYVPSLDEAVHQTGLTDPHAIIRRYRELGARGIVGVKLGTKGAVLTAADGDEQKQVTIPCIVPPSPVVDTTGAGDAFLAGLLTGLLREMPLRQAGLLAAANAAYCVTGYGATAALRDFETTMALATCVP